VAPEAVDEHAVGLPPVVAPAASSSAHQIRTMQCMEVWGGNTAIDSAVAVPGLDVWVYAKPYQGQAAGGDVHYVSSCATGRISRLLVADVSGHGTKVSELARSLRDCMRRHVNFLDQSRFVRQLNTEFSSLTEMGRFATAIVATYWAPTDYLVASNAGHPRPLLYRARDRAWRVLSDPKRRDPAHSAQAQPAGDTPNNLPLGIDDVSNYDQFAVKLEKGDLVLLYTDSLIEARPPGGAMLQELGLLKLVAQLDPTDPHRLVHELVRRVEAYCAPGDPGDDVTILALAPTGIKPRPTLSARVGAISSFLQTLAASWRPNAPPVPWPEFSIINILGPFIPGINRRHGG
jgi:hypothetical protein